MHVYVSKKHIRRGVRRDCDHCPIALAAQELLPNKSVTVFKSTITVNGDVYELPQVAKQFITDYDHRAMVLPIEFDLPL